MSKWILPLAASFCLFAAEARAEEAPSPDAESAPETATAAPSPTPTADALQYVTFGLAIAAIATLIPGAIMVGVASGDTRDVCDAQNVCIQVREAKDADLVYPGTALMFGALSLGAAAGATLIIWAAVRSGEEEANAAKSAWIPEPTADGVRFRF